MKGQTVIGMATLAASLLLISDAHAGRNPGEHSYTIVVGGSAGRFRGSYLALAAGGSSSHSVEGNTRDDRDDPSDDAKLSRAQSEALSNYFGSGATRLPGTRFTIDGTMVSVSFQKLGEYGSLRVSIERDGILIKSEATTAAYGVVMIATR
jgi:hypothetical protein